MLDIRVWSSPFILSVRKQWLYGPLLKPLVQTVSKLPNPKLDQPPQQIHASHHSQSFKTSSRRSFGRRATGLLNWMQHGGIHHQQQDNVWGTSSTSQVCLQLFLLQQGIQPRLAWRALEFHVKTRFFWRFKKPDTIPAQLNWERCVNE